MTRAMTAQGEKESHWMRLIDLEGDTNFTPKSVGREGSKAWALSVVPHFSLSPPRLAFLAWGDFHARSRFARSTIPKEKWGLLVVYPDKDFELRTKIEISRQVRRRQSTGRDSRCFG